MEDQVAWLLLDLNSYFASCEQQENPALRGQPVAVVPLLADSTSCIAASYEAKAFGVKTGTKVGDARRMCPDLKLVVARHELYVKFHHQIIEATEACLPVTRVLSIDEMTCELTGSHRNIPKAIELAGKIKATLNARVGVCMKSSIGIATNVFLAKVASDMKKPDGLTIIRTSTLPSFLFQLKLRDFPGIGPRMEERLHKQGIFNVQKLCAQTPMQMRTIWGGVLGEVFYKWLRGVEINLWSNPHKSIGHSHVLGPDLRSKPQGAVVLKKLLSKAAVRLRKDGYFARELSVIVKFLDQDKWEVKRKFTETQDTLFFFRQLDEMVDEMPTKKPLRVGVVLGGLIPAAKHQLELFFDGKRQNLMDALDSINGKYGRDAIRFGALFGVEGSANPHIAFQRVPGLDEF